MTPAQGTMDTIYYDFHCVIDPDLYLVIVYFNVNLLFWQIFVYSFLHTCVLLLYRNSLLYQH